MGDDAAEVIFPTSSPRVLTEVPQAREIPARGLLYLPRGPSYRRPAVVVMEGLGGLKPAREPAYGRRLAERGYVALVVDSFGSRGAAHLSHPQRALRVTETMMLADAFAALRSLAGHPAVDPERVAVMGFSYGGMIAVLSAYEQMASLYAPGGERFAGHISYYGCSVPRLEEPAATGAPVRLLLGGADANVSLARSRLIAADLMRGGAPVEVTVFPGAHHQWDSDDLSPRFERFSLIRLGMRVDRANRIFDEGTGLPIRGRASRAVAIAAGLSLHGYTMLRDEAVFRQSEAILSDFLAQVFTGPYGHRARLADPTIRAS